MTTKTLRPARPVLIIAAALLLAACGGGDSSSPPASGGSPKLTRGAVTAKDSSSITVNGVRLATGGGTTVRVDDNPGGLDDVRVGDVVRVHGNMDDRNGDAAEIEVEHGVEGQVDDKGTDFIVVGGTRVQVDDSTHLDDRFGGFDGNWIGTVVMVSGVPVAGTPGAVDDKGGLRASRIDRSPRHDDADLSNDDDFDVKGFVSALGATTFELRSTPDAVAYYVVNFSAIIPLPPGVQNGAFVEVHSLVKPSAATPPEITASSIHLEDAASGSQVEVEGYVTSISVSPFAAGGWFRASGVKVQTSASTQFLLGDAGNATDVVVGAKVEAEGSVDASGVLVASKVKFRPGVRITAIVQNYTGTDMTLLGIPVQIPSWLEDKLTNALANDEPVEVRGNPTANGLGVVAYRIDNPSGGGGGRVFLRAMVTAKVGETLTVFGFRVTPPTSTNSLKFSDQSPATNRAAWFNAIEPGHTVVKLRANAAGDVNSGSNPKTWIADEIEIEGND